MGFQYLRVSLGTDEYKEQNWEGQVEKVCARLSLWQWQSGGWSSVLCDASTGMSQSHWEEITLCTVCKSAAPS